MDDNKPICWIKINKLYVSWNNEMIQRIQIPAGLATAPAYFHHSQGVGWRFILWSIQYSSTVWQGWLAWSETVRVIFKIIVNATIMWFNCTRTNSYHLSWIYPYIFKVKREEKKDESVRLNHSASITEIASASSIPEKMEMEMTIPEKSSSVNRMSRTKIRAASAPPSCYTHDNVIRRTVRSVSPWLPFPLLIFIYGFMIKLLNYTKLEQIITRHCKCTTWSLVPVSLLEFHNGRNRFNAFLQFLAFSHGFIQ